MRFACRQPNVSMAVANLNLEKGTNKEELNEYLREMALSSTLSAQIDYTDSTEIVSTDLVGSRTLVWLTVLQLSRKTTALFSTFGTTTNLATAASYLLYGTDDGCSLQDIP